ncbi:Limb region 1 -like protein [Homalodisca vitripennis]|nr:Limb region 1 -like protein [Homalodisca vitripennis]
MRLYFSVCTPIGFARLFSIVSSFLVKPQFLQDINQDFYVASLQENCFRRRLERATLSGKTYLSPEPMYTPPPTVENEDSELLKLQNGALQACLMDKIEEMAHNRQLLDRQRHTWVLQRNVVYPVCMLILLALTAITVLIVVQNTIELLIGIKALPISSRVFPEVAVSSDQGNHLLNPIPAQPHQPSGEAGARISKQSFAECLSLVTLPPQAVCLPGPFVYTLDTIDFGLKYGAVPTQTAAKGSSRGLTKHSISSSTLNKRAIHVPDKALSYCWDVILRFPLISGVEVNREWLIEYELRSHYVGDHFENSAWVYSFSDGAMARVRHAIPPQASNHQPIS